MARTTNYILLAFSCLLAHKCCSAISSCHFLTKQIPNQADLNGLPGFIASSAKDTVLASIAKDFSSKLLSAIGCQIAWSDKTHPLTTKLYVQKDLDP